MTALLRVTSASAASWVRIAVTLGTQIFLLPVYLSYWDRETYGTWLAVQAAISLTTLPDIAYQNYLGFEFLKLGRHEKKRIALIFSASIPISLSLGVIELLAVLLAVLFGVQNWLFGARSVNHPELLRDAGFVLLIQSAIWPIVGSVGGTAGRLLHPFGYFPRMSWWGVFAGIVVSVAPALAVSQGAGLRDAGIVLGVSTILYNVPLFWDMFRIARKEGIVVTRPDLALGLGHLWKSLALMVKSLLETARQQGIRVILSPLVGVSEMAAFATMRTGANSVLQGLNTITSPLMPELMRFLAERDQAKCEASFGVVWLVVMICMAPAVIVLQWGAPQVFELWTRGRMPFDPLLFAVLSDTILIYALSQPAMAIVQGNNLLRSQLLISAAAGICVIMGLLIMVPHWSILGAGLALMLAEIASLAGYVFTARRWLDAQAMNWPSRAFLTVAASVLTAIIATAAIAILPSGALPTMVASVLIELLLSVLYWKQIPAIARARAAAIAASMSPRAFGRRLVGRVP